MYSPINTTLNKLHIWLDKECERCGRQYPETVLNIEGAIHHNCTLKCLDTKECNKVVKRNNRSL